MYADPYGLVFRPGSTNVRPEPLQFPMLKRAEVFAVAGRKQPSEPRYN